MNTEITLYKQSNLSKIVERATSSTAIALFNREDRVNLQTLLNNAPAETVKLLSVILLKLFSDLNVEKHISAEWFQELSTIIMERYVILSIEDIVKACRNIKAGDYGKNYNNFTMAYIIECIGMYEQDLLQEIDQQHERQKRELADERTIQQQLAIYEKLKKGENLTPINKDDEREKNKKAKIWYEIYKGKSAQP